MRRLQFSLRGLFILMTGAALALGALAQASAGWCSATRLGVIAALLAGFVGALVRTGAPRAFWIGWAAFGWGYLVITNGLAVQILGPQAENRVESPVVGWIYEQMHGKWPGEQNVGGGGFFSLAYQRGAGDVDGPSALGGVGGSPSPFPDFEMAARFADIAQWLFVLLMALLGGVVGRVFSALNRPDTDAAPRP